MFKNEDLRSPELYLRAFLPLLIFFLTARLAAQYETTTLSQCPFGEELLRNYHFEDALYQFKECLDANPEDIYLISKMAYCQVKSGRLAGARDSYKKILACDPADVSALNQLGSLYIRSMDYARAQESYARLIAIDSLNAYYFKKYAEVSLKRSDLVSAVLFYSRGLELDPNDLEIIMALLPIYLELKLFDEAGALLSQGKCLDSNSVRLCAYAARLAYVKKDYNGVVREVGHCFSLGADSSSSLRKMLGIALFFTSDYGRSLNVFQSMIRSGTESEMVHYYMGMNYRELGELQKAARHFEKAIELAVSGNISNYYTYLGICYEEMGDYLSSIKMYKEAYRISEDKILLYHLARNYDAYYGDKKTALLYYQTYLKSNDTANRDIMDYSGKRISELKEVIHFSIDTLE